MTKSAKVWLTITYENKKVFSLVFVVVILLLAGCQRSDQKGPAKTAIQSGKEPADSLKKDSVEAFNERMMRWKVLHGGMSRWESDK